MTLDPDEVAVAVPANVALPQECRQALETYATRPILRRGGVGVIYFVAESRLTEIETLAASANVPIKRLPCATTI